MSLPNGNHLRVLEYLQEAAPRTMRSFERIALDLQDEIDEQSLREILSHERLNARITSGRDGYRLTSTARSEMFKAKTAQPPLINHFTPPISKKYIPSTLGMREGSNDHLEWKSKFA